MLYKRVQIILGWLDGFSVSWEGCMWLEIIVGRLGGLSVDWEGCISGLRYLLLGWVGS